MCTELLLGVKMDHQKTNSAIVVGGSSTKETEAAVTAVDSNGITAADSNIESGIASEEVKKTSPRVSPRISPRISPRVSPRVSPRPVDQI